jgi:Cell division protein FtsI/penicillin-binding protein 2
LSSPVTLISTWLVLNLVRMQTETFQKTEAWVYCKNMLQRLVWIRKQVSRSQNPHLMCQIPTQSRLISDRVPMLIPPVSWHVMQQRSLPVEMFMIWLYLTDRQIPRVIL